MSNVDWEFIEMNFPGLVKRIDEFDRKIDAVNRAFDRGAGCVTRDPDTWGERRNRYALECCSVYEELIVLDPIACDFTYADLALLAEARVAGDDGRCEHGWTGPWFSRPCGCGKPEVQS